MSEQRMFVSYSRRHEGLVTPLVKLLRFGDHQVFQDVTSVEIGSKWEQSILDSLNQASVVVIIWCSHAESSEWVKNELRVAAETGKTIIPVFIDKTPLPDQLGQFQGLDLSGEVNHRLGFRFRRLILWFAPPLCLALLILVLYYRRASPAGPAGMAVAPSDPIALERSNTEEELDAVRISKLRVQRARDELERNAAGFKSKLEAVRPQLTEMEVEIKKLAEREATASARLEEIAREGVRMQAEVEQAIREHEAAAERARRTKMLITAATVIASVAFFSVMLGIVVAMRKRREREQGEKLALTVLKQLGEVR